MAIWQKEDGDGVLLRVQVTPRSSRNAIGGEVGDALSVRLTAPPVDNRANGLLTRYMSEIFRLKKGDVTVASGEKSRKKVVRLGGISTARVKEILEGFQRENNS